MTGPQIPFFTPDLKPAWTFNDPQGDFGAIGAQLSAMADTMAKAQQQKLENEQKQQMILMKQMELQDTLSTNEVVRGQQKLDMKRIQAEMQQREDTIKAQGEAGGAIRQGVLGSMPSGVGDAEVQEPFAGRNYGIDLITALLNPGLSDQGVAQIPGIGQAMQPAAAGPAVDMGLGGTRMHDTYGRATSTVPYTPDPRRGAGGGGGGAKGPDEEKATLLSAERQELMAGRQRAMQAEQAIPTYIGQAKLARRMKPGDTGMLANFTQGFGKTLVALGFADEETVKDVAKREEYMAASAWQGIELLSSGRFGDARSLTDADREFALSLAGSNLKLEPRTIRIISKLLIGQQELALRQHAEYLENHDLPKGFKDKEAFYGRYGDPARIRLIADRLATEANRVWGESEEAYKRKALEGMTTKGKK